MPENEGSIQMIANSIKNEGLNWTAGDTELTALSPAEQRAHLGVIVTPEEMQKLTEETRMQASAEVQMREYLFETPTSFDWRNVGGQNYVTSVKNQGSCGSCVAFCTCAVMESAVRIKLGNPTYNVDLSEAFCQFCGGGSCGGWGLTSGLAFAQSTGVTDEACMPYQPTNMNCAASRCADWQNRLTKITSYTAHSTMAARKNAIATLGPLLAGMAVYNDFFAYTGGVYQKTAGSSLEGYHCITVVGYNDSQQCWILKNSWGPNWGDSGYCRIRYGQADLLIDSSWSFYSVVIQIPAAWHANIVVNQTYTTRHSQNAWAHFQGLGWRRIKTGAADGVTNMLILFAEAVANNKRVTIYADGDFVYQAYLL
jgi:C1A family cysteine protease